MKDSARSMKNEYRGNPGGKGGASGAPVLTHPECPEAVCRISDYIGSTSGIIRYAQESSAREFIVCTESGVRYELEKKMSGQKILVPGDRAPVHGYENHHSGEDPPCAENRRK